RVGQCESFLEVSRTDQRLLVTVSMNQRLGFLPVKLQFPTARLLFFHDEFFEKKRCLRNISGVVVLYKVRVLVPERQNATGLTAYDGVALFHESIKLADIELRVLACFFGQPFGNHRPAAAFSLLRNLNFITGCLEKLCRSLSDLRVVEVQKRVVEQNDL